MHLLLSLPHPWIWASGSLQTLAASAGSSAEPQHQRGRPPRLSTRQCSVCISQKMIWANRTPAAAAAVQFVAARFSSLLLRLQGLNVSPVTSSRPRQRGGPGPRAESWHFCSSAAPESGQTDFLHPHPPPVLTHPVTPVTSLLLSPSLLSSPLMLPLPFSPLFTASCCLVEHHSRFGGYQKPWTSQRGVDISGHWHEEE